MLARRDRGAAGKFPLNHIPQVFLSGPVQYHFPRLARTHHVEAFLELADGEVVGKDGADVEAALWSWNYRVVIVWT